jgi:hypothetical protein
MMCRMQNHEELFWKNFLGQLHVGLRFQHFFISLQDTFYEYLLFTPLHDSFTQKVIIALLLWIE